MDKLKNALVGVEVVQWPERDVFADTFWSRAFERPPGQRATQIYSDSMSVAPSSPPIGSGSHVGVPF